MTHPPDRADEPRPTTVVFVDDDRLVADPLVTVLGPRLRRRGFSVLPLVSDLVHVPQVDAPGVAVCDVVLRHGLSGPAAVARLVESGWAVLLISGRAPSAQVLESICAGARGYLEKSALPEELELAIVDLARMGWHLSAPLAAMLYTDLHRRLLPGPQELIAIDRLVLKALVQGEDLAGAGTALGLAGEQVAAAVKRIFHAAVRRRERTRLTARETDVVRLVGCDHEPTGQVARRLFISANTVNTHLHAIKAKYLASHPEAPPGLSQRRTAQLWAEELNLCQGRVGGEARSQDG